MNGPADQTTKPTDAPESPTAPPLTNAGFVGYASRIAGKAAHWSADTVQCFFIAPPDTPIEREPALRFIGEMRRLLDHMESQVQP